MDEETTLDSLTCKSREACDRFKSPTYYEIQSPDQYSPGSKESRITGTCDALMSVVFKIIDLTMRIFLNILRWLKRRHHQVIQIVWPIKSLRLLKLRHYQVLEIVKEMCLQNARLGHTVKDQDRLTMFRHVYCSAVQNGVYDIVKLILPMRHSTLELKDDDGYNALQVAALHRDGKTFHLIQKNIRHYYDNIKLVEDDDGNNILHLVAKRAQRLGIDSEEVLQLQREFQWYKGLEKILPYELRFRKNSDKKVPFELFKEEHRDMLKSEGEWITSMANSCMVAGSLIAAVVFAAAITLPGGNEDNGLPNFSKKAALKVFAVSDAFALVSSLIAVVTFLSIFTTRYSAESFRYDLPNRLIFGLISLFLSVTFMMIAFGATVHLLFAEDYKWIIYPTVIVSFLPVFFFGLLQLPSLLNIIKSTYFHDIFKDSNVRVFKKE